MGKCLSEIFRWICSQFVHDLRGLHVHPTKFPAKFGGCMSTRLFPPFSVLLLLYAVSHVHVCPLHVHPTIVCLLHVRGAIRRAIMQDFSGYLQCLRLQVRRNYQIFHNIHTILPASPQHRREKPHSKKIP